MATEELLKVRILGLQKDKATVLDFLQVNALMHLSSYEEIENTHDLDRDRSAQSADEVVTRLLELEWMEEQLKQFTKRKPHLHFPSRKLGDALSDVERLKSRTYSQLRMLISSFNENADSIAMLSQHAALLRRIPFSLPQGIALPHEGQFTFTYLFEDLEEPVPTAELFGQSKLTIQRKDGHILVQGYRSQQAAVDDAARTYGLRTITVPHLKKAKEDELATIKKHLSALKDENRKLEAQLHALASEQYLKVSQLRHELTIFHDRYEAAGQFLRTGATFFAQGYVPVSKAGELKRIGKFAKVHILTEAVDEGPTKLRNSAYVRKFEFITKMFGVPTYGRVDPTIYISIFLPFFFGFMFSDIGYGVLLGICATYLYWKAPTDKPILRDAGYVLFISSITTILFGWFFGSFFGALIPITPLIFDPFTNAKWVLISSLAIGLLHLNIGIFTGISEKIKAGQLKDVFLTYGSILSLQIGVVLIALGYSVGWVLFGLAIGLFLLKSGLMGLMDISGFVGTWFSYARLLALSLATGGIALGINIMAQQLSHVGLFGPLLFVLLVVFGHLFNFALNVLGSTIHSVRLHYIEFFSQFYEGGGKPFVPFTTERIQETL